MVLMCYEEWWRKVTTGDNYFPVYLCASSYPLIQKDLVFSVSRGVHLPASTSSA